MFLSTNNSFRTLCAVLLFFVFASCARTNPNTAEVILRRQLVDDSGKTVLLPEHVDRVISLAPNLTEIVFAVGAGSKLVGRTTFCDFPAEAKQVALVGDTQNPSLEKIIALKPQVVLVSTASQLEAFTKQLQDHNIVVFVTDPHDLEGVFRSIQKIGEFLEQDEKTRQLIASLRQRVSAVEAKVNNKKPVRVFYQLSVEPLYTAGKDSFVNDLIRRAGAVSVTADVPGEWPRYSAEAAVATKPEAIILPTGGSMGDSNATVTKALMRAPAVTQGRVYKINGDHLVRPGPRVVDGLEETARALHPEAFKE